ASLAVADENSASDALSVSSAQSISIPAGDLREALKSLARQTSSNLVFRPEQVDGLRTEGVSGALSMQEALAALLKGTELEVNQDERTGAILIAMPKRAGKAAAGVRQEQMEAMMLARNEPETAPKNTDEQGSSREKEDSTGVDKLDEIVVTAQ